MIKPSPDSFVLAVPNNCQMFGGFQAGHEISHIQFSFDGDRDDIHLLFDRPALDRLAHVVQRLLATPEPQDLTAGWPASPAVKLFN